MFYTLLRLYSQGRLTEQGLSNAVEKHWITEEEKEEIVNSKGV